MVQEGSVGFVKVGKHFVIDRKIWKKYSWNPPGETKFVPAQGFADVRIDRHRWNVRKEDTHVFL